MKQTAVEYIKDKLFGDEYWYENMTFEQIFEQAKEMEKEQIVDAYDRGYDEYDIYRNGQNYYNETFKSE
jgi:hypothetical protein